MDTARFILAYACQKGVHSHTPLLVALVHPRDKEIPYGWLRHALEACPILQILVGVDWTETMDAPVGRKQCTPF